MAQIGGIVEVPDVQAGILFGLVEPGPPLAALWPAVVSFLAAALEHSLQHEWTTRELLERIESGEFLLAVVSRDLGGQEPEILGAAVFDNGIDPLRRRYVAMVCCGGLELEHWITGLVALTKHLGECAKAERVVIMGRRGWARVLRPYGLRVAAIVASCAIEDIRVDGSIEEFRG